MMCFLLPFKMIFHILRNKYLTFKDFCIAFHILLSTVRKYYLTHIEGHTEIYHSLLSSFVIYFFCICYLGSFPIVVIATFHTDIVTHASNTFSLGFTTYQLKIPKISKKDVW